MSSPAVPLSSQQGESSRTSQKHHNETGEASPNNGRPVSNLNFDNLTLRSLPIDPEQRNFVRQVPNACFSLVKPTPVVNPKLVMHSESALKLVDVDVAEVKSDDFVEYFSGNRDIPGAQYAAHCYCGHQFGHFSGQLGDGATMYIGEIVNSQNERWEIQFKGAGKTPYSRSADGRKVLRSSMREFMCSELMHSLGIPTTRAGTVVTSDTKVVRDIFYSGDPIHEPATIITRIAPTFLRFGSFEIFKPTDSTTGRTGPSVGNIELLRKLTEFTIQTYYPHVWSAHSETEDRYYYFYREVCERTARLVAEWQSVGWCHGVLNTDNMSIVGVTIDYGPFGFVEHFDPNFICNDSDDGGRYTYAKQPQICRWNCMKLGESLAPILPLARSRAALIRFDDVFNEHLTKKMNQKLGLVTTEADDEKLVDSLFTTLEETAADFTNTFRCLSSIDPDLPQGAQDPTLDYLLTQCAPPDVCGRSGPRMQPQQLQMLMMLARSDPGILRQLGMSLEDLQNEIDKAKQAEEAKSISPDEKTAKNREIWSSWLSVYRSRLQRQASQVSATQRRELMDSVNPRYVLRNYIAQKAIDDATAGNYSTAHSIFKMLSTPFKDQSAEVGDFYDGPPHNRAELRVT